MSIYKYTPRGPVGRFVHGFEENAIAVLLGLMTMVTFTNVVLRYGFNKSLIWGQEVTLILFAWLVLLGISYGVKVTAHLGVDAIINMFSPKVQRIAAIFGALVCVVYAGLLLKGAWDYWANFGNLPQTTGRWFPTGLQDMRPMDMRGYKPTIQVPMIEWMRGPLESWLLVEGDEPFEKLPVAVPYMIIPVGAALLLFRFVQATVELLQLKRSGLIVSHEAEDAVEEVAVLNRD